MPILQYILTIKRNLSQAASRQAMEIDRRRILSTNQRKMLWRKENTRYQLLSTLYFENTLLYLSEAPGEKRKHEHRKGSEVMYPSLDDSCIEVSHFSFIILQIQDIHSSPLTFRTLQGMQNGSNQCLGVFYQCPISARQPLF